ncbi:site-2 protease family protein, partial [Patescibacteria group bacterium]|nr:site-2 protease family protein [Patescibacteria group bacterium]
PVPFNPYNLKYPRWGSAMVAAAGPISNLLSGTVFALLVRVLGPMLGQGNLLVLFLVYGAMLNFLLMIFNLIPLPPLDGSKALFAVLADERHRGIRTWIETRGPILLMGLILMDLALGLGVFNWISWSARALVELIVG